MRFLIVFVVPRTGGEGEAYGDVDGSSVYALATDTDPVLDPPSFGRPRSITGLDSIMSSQNASSF